MLGRGPWPCSNSYPCYIPQVQTPVNQTLLEPVPDQRQPPPSRHQRLHQLPHLLLYWQEVQGCHEENFHQERDRDHQVKQSWNRFGFFLVLSFRFELSGRYPSQMDNNDQVMGRKKRNLGSTSVQTVQTVQTVTTSPDGNILKVQTLKTDRSDPVVQTESVSPDRGVSSDRSSLLYQIEYVSQVTTF